MLARLSAHCCDVTAVGEALIRGFCEAGISSADRLSASVRSSERQQKMTSLGVRVFEDATKGGAKQVAANRCSWGMVYSALPQNYMCT